MYTPTTSRLTDWSYAGYEMGEQALPTMPAQINLRSVFGARADGVADDTPAFDAALAAIDEQGTIFLPAGTYTITKKLDITKRVFFQGEGAGRTILWFPRPLSAAHGNTWPGGRSQWSQGPGFINFNGGDAPDAATFLARVTGPALRGSDTLTLDRTGDLAPGRLVRLVLDNTNNTLLASLNQGLALPNVGYANRLDVIRWTSRVKAVLANPPRVQLERLLPFDVLPAFSPELHEWNKLGHGVKRNYTGAADLTVRFPATTAWPGEGREQGFNAFHFFGTAHSFVRNVVFENAELGVAFDSASFSSVENVTFTSGRPVSAAAPYTGSWGIFFKGTFDCVASQFFFNTRLKAELALTYFAVGNVFANGVCVDCAIEVLWGAPYANLFSNIQLGAGTEPFGSTPRGPDASGHNTLWNLRTRNGSLTLPPATWAPVTTVVNAMGAPAPPGAVANAGWLVDSRPVQWPFELWSAMRRLRGMPLPPRAPVRLSGPGYGCFANNTKCCWDATASCPRCPADARNPSVLWGCNGELWQARGRLRYDWGFAGYRQGSASPPSLPVAVDVRAQFGARGDGVTDDTAALRRAIDATASGVLFLPAGTYVLTGVIDIRKPLVLRGAGRGATVLRFPRSLSDLFGNTWSEGGAEGVSQYSHSTGFINFLGWDPMGGPTTLLTSVTQRADAGERILRVTSSASIALGSWVRLLMQDPGDGSLMAELLGRAIPPPPKLIGLRDPVRFLSRVVAKGDGWVRLERSVPTRVELAWAPQLHAYAPSLNDNVGVEALTIQFPVQPYGGHFREAGYNGLHFNQVANGWVRGVGISNADMGLYCWGCTHMLVDDVVLDDASPDEVHGGHRGIWFERGSDNLVQRFTYASRFVHDLTVAGTEHGSVFHSGSGRDINMDAHRSAPFCNLFSNIQLGLGSRPFAASGDRAWGPHSGMLATFHNVSGSMRLALPQEAYGPHLTFLGLPTDDPRDPQQLGWHVELLARPHPPNLWEAMRRTRGWRNPVR